jgi:hypothetical protein
MFVMVLTFETRMLAVSVNVHNNWVGSYRERKMMGPRIPEPLWIEALLDLLDGPAKSYSAGNHGGLLRLNPSSRYVAMISFFCEIALCNEVPAASHSHNVVRCGCMLSPNCGGL